MELGGTCLIASFDRFAKLAQLGDLRQVSKVTDASAWGLETGLRGYRCFGLGSSNRYHRLQMLLLGHFRQASQVTQHMLQLGVLRQVSQVTDAQYGNIRHASQVRDVSAWGLETGVTGYATHASAWGLETGITGYRCFCLGISDRRHRLHNTASVCGLTGYR